MTTGAYTASHAAFRDVARAHGLTPIDARVLVALWDRGGQASTLELELDLRAGGAAVRRALIVLFAGALVAGERKRGTRMRPMLTPAGQRIVSVFMAKRDEYRRAA